VALNFINPGQLQQLGTALIAQVQIAFPPTLFQFEVMPSKLTPQAWTALVRRVPFVGLGWNGVEPAPDMGRGFRGVSRWTLYLVTRNSAGELGRYFGDAQGPGLLQMVQAAVVLLQGADIGGVGTAAVRSVANAVAEGWEGGNAVIAAVDIDVPVDLTLRNSIDGASVDMDALKTLAIAWDFLPATGSLTDTITGIS
jgi:hypothetical protein